MKFFEGIKKKKSEGVKLSPPWYTLYNEISKFFAMDDELNVSEMVKVNKSTYSIIISSVNTDKIIALSKILPETVNFGNINVYIYPKVENDEEDVDVDGDPITIDTYKTAFAGNKYFVDVVHVDQTLFTPSVTYIVLSRDIISFFNDDLTDYEGQFNAIVSDVASNIMMLPSGTYFCTEAVK